MSKAKLKPLQSADRRDLVVLAADKDTEQALTGLLSMRLRSLRIRPLKYDIIRHPEHDPGCLRSSHDILTSYVRTHDHAVVVFDREGCGRDARPREELETVVESDLEGLWSGRAAVVVIDPELEAWVWGTSPHVPTILGWKSEQPLPDWLVENEFLDEPIQVKPDRPKEAMDAVLRHVRRPHSSAIFRQLAESVSFGRCIDPAFLKLTETLRRWFPAT